MNFELSEEQTILKDSVSKFINDRYELESRRGYLSEVRGFNEDNWQQFAELGWLSVPFSEDLGGFGGGAVDVMVLMEEFGKGLVAEPYVATVILFGGALAASSNTELQQQLIPSIIDGSLQGALAFHERDSRYSFTAIETTATAVGDGYKLSGEKTIVYNGAAADKLIVSARLDEGVGLYLVNADASGLSRTTFRLMDGQQVANIRLDAVAVEAAAVVARPEQGLQVLQQVAQDAVVALSAEAQGAMQVLLESTLEYSKTRKQFGVAIGSFQALQHRMVDMFSACEENRSLLYRTVCALDEDQANRDELDIRKSVHALKTMVGRSGKKIGAEAIQLHGGMGMTDELAIGHYVKRLMTINTCMGDADYHQRRFAELSNAA